MSPLVVRDLGHMGYAEALDAQRDLNRRRQQELIGDTLLFVEHPPVISMGRRAVDSDILIDRAALEQAGVAIHRIERGGETTYHGPGQLVGYLIVHLYRRQRHLRAFIDGLEGAIIDTLGDFGISAHRREGHPGVWVGSDKIAALGIAIVGGVTLHGFAINVATDLAAFDWIVACGIRGRAHTSMSRLLGRDASLDEVKAAMARRMERLIEQKYV